MQALDHEFHTYHVNAIPEMHRQSYQMQLISQTRPGHATEFIEGLKVYRSVLSTEQCSIG